jgi:hypothetical protein
MLGRRKKDSMIGCPSTYVMTVAARHRREALHAEANRERLVRLAMSRHPDRRPLSSVLAAAGLVIAALAHLMTTGSAAADESLLWDQSRAVPVEGRGDVSYPEEHLLNPTVARQISASRL